ncbi:hypothetical protein [Streptomyces sp. NPDC001665]
MTESAWHHKLKGWGVDAEIRLGNRRADCLLHCGKRAEIQARPLPAPEVTGREAHTDLWILDCRSAYRAGRLSIWEDAKFGTLLRWDRTWHGFAVAKRTIFLNLQLDLSTGNGTFLEVTGWTFENFRATGSGRRHTAHALRSWMRNGTPLPGTPAVPQ